MGKRLSFLVLLMGLLLTVVVTGCGSSGSSSSSESTTSESTSGEESAASSSGGEKYKVELVSHVPLAGNPFYSTLECRAEEKAGELGIELHSNNPTEIGVQYQLPVLQAAIATHPDAIITSAVSETALTPTINQAISEGIKVVEIDQIPSETKGVSAIVKYEGVGAGEQGAEALEEAMPEGGKIVNVSIEPGIPTLDEIETGLKNKLEGSNVEFKKTIFDKTNSNTDSANLVSAELSADSEVKGVYAMVSNLGSGSLAGVKESGRSNVAVVSTYTDTPQLEGLKSGEYAALIGLPAGQIGEVAVEEVYKALTGEPTKKETILPTAIMTKENMEEPEIKPYQYVTGC